MATTRAAAVAVLLCVAIFAVSFSTARRAPERVNRKQLAGPPEEFLAGQFALPDPVQQAQDASTAFIDIVLSKNPSGVYSWSGEVDVDSTSLFAVGLFAAKPDNFEIVVDSSKAAPIKDLSPYGIDGDTFPFLTWRWENPTPGEWSITIKTSDDVSSNPKAVLVVYNQSPMQLFAHLNTYDLQVDQEIGIVANLYDAVATPRVDGQRPAPLKAASLQAEMDVTFPDGKTVAIAMHDDGLHADLDANDGVYAGVLEAVEAGTYTTRTVFKGVTSEGRAFMRTTDHLISVVQPDITLTGLASAVLNKAKNLIQFNIHVDLLSSGHAKMASEDGLTVRAFAEVWGTDSTGYEYVPVAWIQAMVDPDIIDEVQVLPMELDAQWVHKAQAQAPFQLRNVWIEERNTNIPYSTRDKIFVESKHDASLTAFRPKPQLKNAPITEQMRNGPKPQWLLNLNSTTAAAKYNLFLVHGYCAGLNEFPTSAFTDSIQFQDFKKSRSNDAFSLEINAQATKHGLGSYSIIAHSQGGLASTHLNTYYWSTLQAANAGGKLIQSVGSPYGGCGFAGSLAGIGRIIGMGCGSNDDLTYDGAALWQKGIPADKRSQVSFYTTVYGSSKGYCAWGANTVLYTPNDGTTEIKYSKLSGATDMGTKSDWCHTTDMQYPNQCEDPARNAEMNANAAR